jgi:hypothetical protein
MVNPLTQTFLSIPGYFDIFIGKTHRSDDSGESSAFDSLFSKI